MGRMVTKKEQQTLLQVARNAILHYLGTRNGFQREPVSSALKERHGVFVTLNLHHGLRGCIGHLLPIQSVYRSVMENAVNAAFHDPRFSPVTKEEMEDVEIEISILVDPVRLDYIDAAHLLKKLIPEEGLILKKGMHTATFLPQVWAQIPEKEEFLMQLCFKAGLPPEAWQDSDAEVYAYKVEMFSE